MKDPAKTPLYRQICGALKQTIRAHGPIKLSLVGSFGKRIIKNISNLETSIPDEPLKEKILEFHSKYISEIKHLRSLKDKIPENQYKQIKAKNRGKMEVLTNLNNLVKSFGK